MQISPKNIPNQTGRGLRQLVLSNFAGEKAFGLHEKRRNEHVERVLSHQQTLQNLSSAYQKTLTEAKNALFRLRLVKALQIWIRSERIDDEIRRIRNHAPIGPLATIEEMQAQSGEAAERRLDEYLATCLDARWTLISGYMGNGGEIDRILIGPWGIYAFEIKGNRGVACSDGTHWWMEKRDRQSQLVSKKPLARAPDAQLSKAVRWLEGWLKRNASGDAQTRIVRVVLFTAEDAQIGAIRNADADVVTTLSELDLGYLFDPVAKGTTMEPDVCERIIDLITRDHTFCEKKRSRKPATPSERIRGITSAQINQPSCAGL